MKKNPRVETFMRGTVSPILFYYIIFKLWSDCNAIELPFVSRTRKSADPISKKPRMRSGIMRVRVLTE